MTFKQWARDLWIAHQVTCWRHMVKGLGVNQCLKHNLIWAYWIPIDFGGAWTNKEYRG